MSLRRDRVFGALALSVIIAVSVILGGLAAGYRPVVLQTGSMSPTAPAKSLIIAAPRAAEDIAVGDVVVMRRPGATPVTHRVIEIESSETVRFAITQGDANEAPDAAPYPLEGEELVAKWIRPGWGGFIQSVFQPGIALVVMGLAVLMLVVQALRSIWAPPKTPSRIEPATTTGSDAQVAKRRSRKPLAIAIFPLTGLFTTGVAWALFDSAEVVSSNDFGTAACFDAQLGSVQSGETVHAVNGNVSVPITPVDPSGSFVLASVRSASGAPPDSLVQVQLGGGGSTVELDRLTDDPAPPPITVAWSVVEYSCGVSVQRGTINGDGSAELNVPITAVDQSTSFALLSRSAPNTSNYYDGDDLQIAELTSATNLQIRAGTMSATQSFAWQVVSFDDPGDAVVQTINTTLGVGTTTLNVSIPTPADPSSTFVLTGSSNVATGNSMPTQMLRATLVDSNTVEISRLASTHSSEISVQVVTLREGSTVRHGTVDFAPGQPVRTVEIDPVDVTRSSAISTVAIPGVASGGRTDFATDDVVGEASATFTLTDAETLSVQRDSTASNASFGWQVIEWAGPGWWNPNYDFRQRIDVNTTTAAPGEYTLPFAIDHAALVTAGLSQADGSDVRVLRWDGSSWTELDRILDDGASWNQVSTTLRFRTTDAIEASGTGTYWLYFGNSSPALAFADPENVFLLTEDFESGTLGDFEDRTGGTAWYTANPWTRRIPITVPAGRVASPLNDFPLLVSMTVADLGTNAQPDGSDIRFTASDGTTPLAHEIESWDPGTGELIAWVNVPSISSASATTIYAYYGASDAPAQQDARAAWPNVVEGAWHLSRNPSGSAPQADDSTVHNHDGLSRGSMTSGDLVPGLIGNAIDFDGVDDMLEVDPFDLSTGGLTLSGWVNLDAYGTDPRVINKAYDPLNRVFDLNVRSGNVRGRVSLDNTEYLLAGTSGAVTLGAWHHLALTWDGATIRLYVDGTEEASRPASGTLDLDPAMPVTIGGIDSLDRQIDGRLDEVRVERVARSVDWLAASESNQRNPAAFLTIGAAQSGSWFAQGTWTARKQIGVDADLVSMDTTNFPLLVEVVDAELQAGALASGADIVFTDADGTTRLDHVIESWDASTGTLSAWVQIPFLSSTTDTQLFAYYGNPSAADQQDPAGVFGANADLAFLGTS